MWIDPSLTSHLDTDAVVQPFSSGELGGPNIHTFPVYHTNIDLHVSSGIGGGHDIFGAVNPSDERFSFFLQSSHGWSTTAHRAE